jgi:hypothetical protein
MSDEKDANVDGVPQVLHDDVLKLNAEDGDALLVTLPETANMMSREVQQQYQESVSNAFKEVFKEKEIKVVVIPHGMKVELLKTNLLKDKADDASE